MKILFIQPQAFKDKTAHVFEPMGLAYIISYLISKGFPKEDLKFCSAAFQSYEQILSIAKDFDLIAFSATSTMIANAYKIAAGIKQEDSSKIIVFGGVHPTFLPEEVLSHDFIDFVVRGEGEITFFELVCGLTGKLPLHRIRGLVFKEGDEIKINPERPLIEDLDSLPFPDREIINQEQYIKLFQESFPKRSARILSSRGCPFNCRFCASGVLWKRRYRFRSASNIIDEISELKKKFNIEHVYFADDTFTINKERVFQFCSVLMNQKIDITWGCNAHINTIDRQMLKAMKAAGCLEVWLGVESGNTKILKELNKPLKKGKIKEVFSYAKEVGINTRAYLIIGSPSESHKTIKETLKLAREIRPDYSYATVLTPYPGSYFYDYALEKGYINNKIDWSEVDLKKNILMPTRYLSREELDQELKKINRRLLAMSPKKWLSHHRIET